MPSPDNTGFAASRYEAGTPVRSPYLQAAYDSAVLTIPSLFPSPSDVSTQDRFRQHLETSWQGLGARGLNNVSSKLLLTLFPPSQPILKYQISPNLTQGVGDDDEQAKVLSEIEAQLAQREIELSELIEGDAIRPVVHEALRQLLVAGNVALNLPESGKMRYFRLNRYVTRRDAFGTIVEAVIKETLTEDTLPEDIQEFVETLDASDKKTDSLGDDDPDGRREAEIDLYTYIKIKPGTSASTYERWQEVHGNEIPGTRGTYPADAPEYIFLRMTRVDGEDYGRGMVEENIGDLISYTGLQRAIIEASAAASDIKWLVDPNGETNLRHLKDAPSGEFVAGRRKDVEALTLDKFADLRTAGTTRDDLRTSLSFVFLLNSAVRRQGERVTAEEIREVARELEDSFGGIYTILSQDFQLPVVMRRERLAEKANVLKPLPKLPNGKPIVRPVIITGLASIGRSHDLDKLRTFLQESQILFQIDPQTGRYFHTDEALRRIGTAIAIPLKGLVKSREEVEAEIAEEQQTAQRQQMLAAATPNAVTQAGQLMQGAQVAPGPAPEQ